MIVQHLLFIALGIAGLYFGGDYLVDGASRLARTLGVPVTIVGLTIVAFGTSMPELVTNVVAATRGTPDLAIGNILGSNIANIAMILGLSAVAATVPLNTAGVWRDWAIMLGVTIGTYVLLVIDGDLSRLDGVILFTGIIMYVVRAVRTAQTEHHVTIEAREAHVHPEQHRTSRLIMLVVFGLALLVIGAQLTVDGAVGIARLAGISELVIGVTLVAVGTSLPELATSVVAAARNEHEIALGNVIGSNIFNLLCILGISGLLSPFAVTRDALIYDGPIMLVISVLLGLLIRKGSLKRRDGAILLLSYMAFLAVIVIRSLSGG
jgi:cation:H+ antiporter